MQILRECTAAAGPDRARRRANRCALLARPRARRGGPQPCPPPSARRRRPPHTRCTHVPAPSETYQYYTLPFCQPEEGKKYVLEDLGEVLEGDRLVSTPYEVKFLVDAEDEELCSKTLNMRDLAKLRTAISRDYYFQVSGGG